MLKGIKNRAFGKFVRSKKYTDTHERKVRDYSAIKSMAFLLDGSDPVALRTILNKLYPYRNQGKKLSFFGYVKKLPPFQEEGIVWITRKDLSWIGIPKVQKIRSFIEKDFDVLINTAMKSIRPLEYVSTYSKAGLRIGMFDEKKTFCYDMMMHLNGNNNSENYLDQVDHYLKMLKAS